MANKSKKTYHRAKGIFINDNDKSDQDSFYNQKLSDRMKRFNIIPECDLDCLYDEGMD